MKKFALCLICVAFLLNVGMVGAQEKREKIQYGYLGPMTEQNAFKSLEIADRGYVLESGKMVLSGSKSELYGHEDVRRAYLGI